MIPTNDIKPLFGKTLDQQLADERRWAKKRAWGLPASAFDNVDTTPSGLTKGLIADVIYSILPDKGEGKTRVSSVQRTFDEGWELGSSLYPGSWRDPRFKSGPKLFRGIKYEPGVYRATVDFGAHSGSKRRICPLDLQGAPPAGPEVLAALRHFPEWVMAMGSEHVPMVWLPAYRVAYEVMFRGYLRWDGVPFIGWRGPFCEVGLSLDWEGYGNCFMAAPRIMSRS